MKLKIKVVPGSSRNEIIGWLGDSLKVAIRAQPQKNNANKAVIALFSRKLEIEKSKIQITSGLTSPRKVLVIMVDDEQQILKNITAILVG